VAYLMLGSTSEADGAVQEAWIRLSRSNADEIESGERRLLRGRVDPERRRFGGRTHGMTHQPQQVIVLSVEMLPPPL
jgi:hypothetical protein